MATRKPILEKGVDQMSVPPTLRVTVDGKISAAMLSMLNRFLQKIVRKINRISLGDGTQGSQAGNIDAEYRDWVSPAAADQQFMVPHGLDRRPVGVFVVGQDRAGSVYYSNRAGWGPSQVFLKTSVGGMVLRLLVF